MNSERSDLTFLENQKIKREAFQQLAAAVILQAWIDACQWHRTSNRDASRKFLTGQTKEWKESLENWCGVANKNHLAVMSIARAKFWDQEKIAKYKRQGR